jgi:ComF family protein
LPGLPYWDTALEPVPQLPRGVDSFAAPFLYHDHVRDWILMYKFNDRTELVSVLATFMVPALPKVTDPLLVPVPLHKSRLRWRLFNQSAMLAATLARHTGAAWAPHALHRVQKTKPQIRQTRKQRQRLSNKAFRAEEKDVRGRHIILIDDIWTTGSTARACAAALKKVGAKRVDVVTIAYVEV